MEVSLSAIVLLLFVLWSDEKNCSKAEASILPRLSKSQQNIDSENTQKASASVTSFGGTNGLAKSNPQQYTSRQGVIEQASASSRVQDSFKSSFSSNNNPGLSISTAQSAVIENNVPRQQTQGVFSSTLVRANVQKSLASNTLEQSSRLVNVNPTASGRNNPHKQDSIVQQKSFVKSTTKAEYPSDQENVSQQQFKVSSSPATNPNLVSTPNTLQNSKSVSPSFLKRDFFQESGLQQQISSKRNVLKSKTSGVIQQPASMTKPILLGCAPRQLTPQNNLKQKSSTLVISSSSQGEVSSTSSLIQSNSINEQNEPNSLQSMSSQNVYQQSNVVLPMSSQNDQTPVTVKAIKNNANVNSISPFATQLVIQGKTPHQSMLVESTATPVNAQKITGAKSPGLTYSNANGQKSNQASIQQNISQQQPSITSSYNSPFLVIPQKTLSTDLKTSSVAITNAQLNQIGFNQAKTSSEMYKVPVSSSNICLPQFTQFESLPNFNSVQRNTPTTILKQEPNSMQETIKIRDNSSTTPSILKESHLKSSTGYSFYLNTVPNIAQQTSVTQETASEQPMNPSNSFQRPLGFFGFPLIPRENKTIVFPPATLLPSPYPTSYPISWHQGKDYSIPWHQGYPSPGLTEIPSAGLTSQNSTSQINVIQPTIAPPLNQVSTKINTISSNTLTSPVSTQRTLTKAHQQFADVATINANPNLPTSPKTIVRNNLEQFSNIPASLPQIPSIYRLKSGGPSAFVSSSNFMNSNIGSVQTILSQSNAVSSDFPSVGSAAPLIVSELRSPIESPPFLSNVAAPWLANVPINSNNYLSVINPFSGNSQLTINDISQGEVLPEITVPVTYIASYPTCDKQSFWFANVNPSLTNLPVLNYGTNYFIKPEATDVLPIGIQQTSLNTVNSIQQSTAVKDIVSVASYQPEVKSSLGFQETSLSSESKMVQSSPAYNYSSKSSVYTDILSPVTSSYTSQPNPLTEEYLLPKLNENKVDLQSSVHTLTTDSTDSVTSTVSTEKEIHAHTSDSGASTSSVNSNVNIAPANSPSSKITVVASVPTIATSETPVCTPSITPSFGGYLPIQPIIVEESNSKTRNWLPVILAFFIRDNGCSCYSGGGGYCTGPCNCGTQCRPVSYQTPNTNNLNPCNDRTGRTRNCGTRGQSNSVFVIKVDSSDTDESSSDDSTQTAPNS